VEAVLALEDGRVFRGKAFGARAERCGEVVFNTSMTGYQEVLTDPSYRGQIVVMTYPEIGICGTNADDREAPACRAEGLVVRGVASWPSNWRATQGLAQFLRQHGTPGIAEVDTRALVRHIRSRGAMRGVLSSLDLDPVALVRKARAAPQLAEQDLVQQVSCLDRRPWSAPSQIGSTSRGDSGPGGRRRHCVVIDYGIKTAILGLLWDAGFSLTRVPAPSTADDVLALEPDAVFLSNGPGDPTVPDYARRTVRELIGRLPIFGICLGHQILALALGARTFKMKFGHRGANHPVRDLRTGRIAVTAQNHGYAVDPRSLPRDAVVTHVNLNDSTLEGFALPEARVQAVQYHPEASPGPHDARGLFREFRELVAPSAAAGPPVPRAGRTRRVARPAPHPERPPASRRLATRRGREVDS
jgi:carbamoyl-phosphate synthase small subunit